LRLIGAEHHHHHHHHHLARSLEPLMDRKIKITFGIYPDGMETSIDRLTGHCADNFPKGHTISPKNNAGQRQ